VTSYAWILLSLVVPLTQALAVVPPSNNNSNNNNMTPRHALPTPLQDRHRAKPHSLTSFLTTALAVPIVSVTVLPLSIVYQVGRRLLQPLFSSKKDGPPLDSGYQVTAEQHIPMAARPYDVVVLGATGFTGALAVRYLVETYGVNSDVKWAIAGRSQAKLDRLKEDLALELGKDEIRSIATIIVDTAIAATLPTLVSQTRCVATTAGPFTLYGSSVVEFCAKFGTHYVDITGEVDWVKAMVVQWSETAQASGAKMIPFCGHDSIPWDLCVMKLQETLQKECGDDLQTVTFWDEVRGAAPGGTIATALNMVAGKSIQAPRVAFDPFLKLPDGSKSAFVSKAQNPVFLAKADSPWEGSHTKTTRWTMPFVMAAVNGSIVRWSHALRQSGSPALTYREYQVCPDFKSAFVNYASLALLGTMLLNPLTLPLMKRFVLPKPGDGPSMKKMLHKHYMCIYGEGIGSGGNRAECIMYFPRDVGCLDTSRMLVESALCLVKDDLPVKEGGFSTPSTGMGQALLDRLVRTGTYFAVRAVPPEEMRSKL
jgi:short subunit dehydrogenase-like uncharacterized protein